MTFKKNEKDLLEADAVIVDEMSMVDLPLMDALLAALCAAEAGERSAAMTALCEKLLDQAPMVPVCFKSYSALLPAGAASSPITPTASNPFYGISDWKLNMK